MQVVVLELIPLKSLTTKHYSKSFQEKRNLKHKLWFTKNYMIRFFHCTLLQNLLSTFKALEGAKQLRFLTVTGNQISTLNGLQCLQNLISLDASNNSIDHINVGKSFYTVSSFCVKWVVTKCKMDAVKCTIVMDFLKLHLGRLIYRSMLYAPLGNMGQKFPNHDHT